MQKEKSSRAVLAKNRNQLIDLMFSSKLKRANEVKVYKEFASVVTFVDRKNNEQALMGTLILTDKVLDESVKDKPSKTTSLPIGNEDGSNEINSSQVTVELDDEPDEKWKSNYWDKVYLIKLRVLLQPSWKVVVIIDLINGKHIRKLLYWCSF
ncbi:MAG: hypothetical protein OR997_01445 [Methylophilaceae bacterium]|nr:hypothetical protein [Methylophilaceae bacterium]